jgi:hypothetical protein
MLNTRQCSCLSNITSIHGLFNSYAKPSCPGDKSRHPCESARGYGRTQAPSENFETDSFRAHGSVMRHQSIRKYTSIRQVNSHVQVAQAVNSVPRRRLLPVPLTAGLYVP